MTVFNSNNPDDIRTETQIHTLYQHHDNGIHEIIVRQASRTAVDEMFDIILKIHAASIDGETIRFLVVFMHSGGVPLSYALARSRRDRAHWKKTTRSANLSNNRSLMNIASKLFGRFFRDSDVRFFSLSERDAAIAWLEQVN